MSEVAAGFSVAERLADRVADIAASGPPGAVRARCEDLLVDVGGLCIAARNSNYARALIAGVDSGGPCTALGHAGGFSAEDAAMTEAGLAPMPTAFCGSPAALSTDRLA